MLSFLFYPLCSILYVLLAAPQTNFQPVVKLGRDTAGDVNTLRSAAHATTCVSQTSAGKPNPLHCISLCEVLPKIAAPPHPRDQEGGLKVMAVMSWQTLARMEKDITRSCPGWCDSVD